MEHGEVARLYLLETDVKRRVDVSKWGGSKGTDVWQVSETERRGEASREAERGLREKPGESRDSKEAGGQHMSPGWGILSCKG